MQLNHLHLHVRDLDVAKTFYERWFGFREHVRHGPILFLRDDADLDLALAPDENPPELPSWFHFGFRLESADAVKAMYDAMTAEGVTIKMPYQAWDDLAAFRCADADGNQIEIYWE